MVLSGRFSSIKAMQLTLIALIFCNYWISTHGAVNCCAAAYSSIPGGCTTDSTYNDVTYTCEDVHGSCTYCQLKSPYSSSQCSKCCVEDTLTCPSDSSVASGWTTWMIVLIVLAGTFLCCAFVFLSAEQSRLKDGVSFQEAYLMPIPMVEAEIDFPESEFPVDQPTAIARIHTFVDVQIAEPTEISPLISRN